MFASPHISHLSIEPDPPKAGISDSQSPINFITSGGYFQPGKKQSKGGIEIRKWVVLTTLAIAMFVLVIDTTIMNVSITALVQDLNTDVTGVQAAITLYALVMATLMITCGKIGDIWGRKRTFRRGLVIYGTGSLITAIAPTIGVLYLGWSFLEGIGGALVLPATNTLVTANFAGKDRALAYGILGGVAGTGMALGPLIGGWITTAYTWRLAFAAEVVFVIIVLFLSREMADAVMSEAKRPKLDLVGTALSAFGLGTIVLAILMAGTYGWWNARNPLVIGGLEITPFGLSVVPFMIGAGILILIGFAFWERHLIRTEREPLVHLNVLRKRTISSGLLSQMFQTTLTGGILFTMALFMQIVLELNAMQTGFLFLPLSIPMLIASLSASRLAFYIPPKRIVQAGFIVYVIGILLLATTLDIVIVGFELSAGFIAIGIGLGFVASQVMNLVLSQVTPERTNETSALMTTSQQFGMSLGTAMLGSILTIGLILGSTALIEESTVLDDQLKVDLIDAIEKNIRFISDTELQELLEDAPPDIAAEILRINESARITGMRTALLAAAAIGVLGIIVSIFLPSIRLVTPESDEPGGEKK